MEKELVRLFNVTIGALDTALLTYREIVELWGHRLADGDWDDDLRLQDILDNVMAMERGVLEKEGKEDSDVLDWINGVDDTENRKCVAEREQD